MRIAQYASMRREKSRVSDAPVHFSHVKASISAAHASPSSCSLKICVSPTHALLPPSFRRRQVSHIQAPEVPESLVVPKVRVPPPTYEASEPVPPPTDEAVEPVSDEATEDDELP